MLEDDLAERPFLEEQRRDLADPREIVPEHQPIVKVPVQLYYESQNDEVKWCDSCSYHMYAMAADDPATAFNDV